MIIPLTKNVFRISFKKFGSYVYLLKLKDRNILIDTGSFENISELKEELKNLNIEPQNADAVILTHNHPDHTGGILLFKNSKIYGSKLDFPDGKIADIKNPKIYRSKNNFWENLMDIKELKIPGMKIIETPGHSKGSICIIHDGVLFSGDTLFHRGTIGRTDLPGSSEKEMQKSLAKLRKIKYEILAPGHGSGD